MLSSFGPTGADVELMPEKFVAKIQERSHKKGPAETLQLVLPPTAIFVTPIGCKTAVS
jgi:hypothetical protein